MRNSLAPDGLWGSVLRPSCQSNHQGWGIFLDRSLTPKAFRVTGPDEGITMDKNATVAIFGLLMVAIIVTVDVLFFRRRFWARLSTNIGIVLVFVALYFIFLKRS